MSSDPHLIPASPAPAEPCISAAHALSKDGPSDSHSVESTREEQESELDAPHTPKDGHAIFFDPDSDVPCVDACARWVKSLCGRHVIVNEDSVDLFICVFDESTPEQIPADFEDRLVSTAAAALATEFMVCRGRLKDLIELAQRSKRACDHVVASTDSPTQAFVAEMRRLARAAKVKPAVNDAHAAIKAVLGPP